VDAIALFWGRKPRRPPRADEVLAAAKAGGAGAALIAPGRTPALRLNSDDGTRYAPDVLAQYPDTLARMAALRQEALRDVDMFARNQRLFIELYFDFIEARVAAERKALGAKLAWADGLFVPEDFVFSAFKLLTNAAFVEVAKGAPTGAVTSCDTAFWTGTRLIAVSIQGAMTGAGQMAPARQDGLILRIAIPAGDLLTIRSAFTRDRFPAEMFAFWEGEDTPSSPFRPEGLSEDVPA
jgi:hypothetical protein